MDVRPVGLFHLVDRGIADEKVLAVALGDPYAEELEDLDDIPPPTTSRRLSTSSRCTRIWKGRGLRRGDSKGEVRSGRR